MLQQLLCGCLGGSGLWEIPHPLLRSCQCDEVNLSDFNEWGSALQLLGFTGSQVGAMETHTQLIESLNLSQPESLRLLGFFLYVFS